MKKYLVLAFICTILFSFTACQDNPAQGEASSEDTLQSNSEALTESSSDIGEIEVGEESSQPSSQSDFVKKELLIISESKSMVGYASALINISVPQDWRWDDGETTSLKAFYDQDENYLLSVALNYRNEGSFKIDGGDIISENLFEIEGNSVILRQFPAHSYSSGYVYGFVIDQYEFRLIFPCEAYGGDYNEKLQDFFTDIVKTFQFIEAR